MVKYRPRRSVLYMPGSNSRALEKARGLAADGLILDLEDAVAPDAKQKARDHISQALQTGGYGQREIIIRMNGLDTPWGAEDLKLAVDVRADAILVPKVNRPEDLMRVAEALIAEKAPLDIALWVMMETPLAILNAADIAACVQDPISRLTCFVMGSNDLIKETGALMTPDRSSLMYSLSKCLMAARGYGLSVLDGVYNDLQDDAGFRNECVQGRQLGMDGKTLIHPKQLAICNEIFAPSPDDVVWARKILQAFELPENKDKGALSLEGQMVERLHADIAAKTVALAEAIEQMETQ